MPRDEEVLFDKLRNGATRKLRDISASQSAAFQGFSTSADNILIFDEVENREDHLRVRVRHEDDSCHKKLIELEKGALRPFLFGKNVARWSLDWKRSWIMFPYERYAKRRTLGGDVIEEWNLIPNRGNLGKFEFLEPRKIEVFEDRFPKAWRYLQDHEAELRKREDDRFRETKSEGHLWYGATYPRGLGYYFRPKLVLQLLSRRNSFAFDREGRFVFQAGGKGGGVYGFAPGEEVTDLGALLAFLNSKVSDFIVKQTSSVYGGRFYSYADQFLKELPIASALFETNNAQKRLSQIAETLTSVSHRRGELRDKIELFPASFEQDVSSYELDAVGKLAQGRPTTAQLSIEPEEISVHRALYGYEARYGTQRPFEFEHDEHAECLAEAFRAHGRRTLSLKEILSWRLPLRPQGCKSLLQLQEKARRELSGLENQIADLETELNDLIYGLYDVSEHEKAVLEGFLERYSSRSAAEMAEEAIPEE